MIVAAEASAALLQRFFEAHRFFYRIKVITSDTGKSFFEFDSSTRDIVLVIRKRNIDVNRHLMMVSKELVYVRRSDFSGSNGFDHRSWTCNAVASGICSFDIADRICVLGFDVAAYDRNAVFFKYSSICRLTDCRNDDLARDLFFRHISRNRTRTSRLISLSCDLRLYPECLDLSVLVGIDS